MYGGVLKISVTFLLQSPITPTPAVRYLYTRWPRYWGVMEQQGAPCIINGLCCESVQNNNSHFPEPHYCVFLKHVFGIHGHPRAHSLPFCLYWDSGHAQHLLFFNFHFIISPLRLLPVLICCFFFPSPNLFTWASDGTDAAINHGIWAEEPIAGSSSPNYRCFT